MTYKLCKLMIQRGLTAGLQEKLDVYFAAGRLTAEQYTELTEVLANAE